MEHKKIKTSNTEAISASEEFLSGAFDLNGDLEF
jgi:hypothetical protein